MIKPILQSEAAECGLACLAMIAAYYGNNTDLSLLRQRYSLSLKGATLAQLIQISSQMHLASRPVRCELEDLKDLKAPCILHWNFNHFVVLVKAYKKHIVILDPALGKRKITLAEVSKQFTGIALELTPTTEFEEKTEKQRLALFSLWKGLRGQGLRYVQILGLSLVLQVFAMLMPLFMQISIDQVLPAGDMSLLNLLAIGFILLVLLNACTEVLRGWIIAQLGTMISFQMTANLFHHLLRLPISFFEKRHLGDIVSRFSSLSHIQKTFTTNFIEIIVDGLMMIVSISLMLLYSLKLTALVVGALLIYGIIRMATFNPLKELSQEQIVKDAKQNSYFLESIRGIQALKIFNRQASREASWQNLLNDSINLGLKVTLIGSVFHVVNTLIFGLENIATVWLGLHEVMNGGFSTGMLFAYISWKGQFTEKTSALIEKFIEFRMLSLHSERVADIALQKTEVLSASGEEKIKILRGMKVENLSYRYSDLEPWIFKDLSFDIYPNECLVLAGNSGCGKSTLLKVLIGLLPAQTGKIEVDQKPLHSLGSAWRESIGVVMQEDSLFAGSIIDNISFNDPKPDMQRIEGAATLAFIKEDILRMPMNWNTLVGDMGSALSGGQKQRLLLARALYRMPRILFLDEASSHLDVTAEKAINNNLKRLGITRIVVAHRPETIASADRVLWLTPLAG